MNPNARIFNLGAFLPLLNLRACLPLFNSTTFLWEDLSRTLYPFHPQSMTMNSPTRNTSLLSPRTGKVSTIRQCPPHLHKFPTHQYQLGMPQAVKNRVPADPDRSPILHPHPHLMNLNLLGFPAPNQFPFPRNLIPTCFSSHVTRRNTTTSNLKHFPSTLMREYSTWSFDI